LHYAADTWKIIALHCADTWKSIAISCINLEKYCIKLQIPGKKLHYIANTWNIWHYIADTWKILRYITDTFKIILHIAKLKTESHYLYLNPLGTY